MKHIDSIFQRMDIRQIRAFLLHGVENAELDDRPYAERLKADGAPIYKRLKALCPDEIAFDEAMEDLALAESAWEEAYMEIGVKAGARLVMQLLK